MKKMKTRTMVFLALMAAIASILMYFEMPLPFMPPFLKLDLSSLPVVLTSFIMGPVQSLFVVLVKDLVHLMSTQTGGVGELADFIMTAAFSPATKLPAATHWEVSLSAVISRIALHIKTKGRALDTPEAS